MNYLKKIIELYKLNYSKEPDSWLEFSKEQKNLADAIKVSTLSINDQDKRHPHQYRIKARSLDQLYSACLQKYKQIKKIKNFHELMEILDSLKVIGIGELTKYDTATRIGAYLNIYPDRVYLHAGTRKGAYNLIGKFSKPYLVKSDLPKAFQTDELNYGEIEDILCIFKDNFSEKISSEEFNKMCLKTIRRQC